MVYFSVKSSIDSVVYSVILDSSLTSRSLAMTEPTDASQDLVLYGLDDKAKPRAGLVPAADHDVALIIAAGLNFQLRPISTAQQRVLAAELAPASLSENGYSAVPAIRRALFAEIENASQEQENSSPEPMVGAGTEQASITPWEAIKIGQVVLAQEDNPKDGWWEAIVLSARRR